MADDPEPSARPVASALQAILAALIRGCRMLVAVPVAVLALSSVVAFLYSCYLLLHVVAGVIAHPAATGAIVVELVKVADVVLVGVVLFVVAVGLEELFLNGAHSRRPWLPGWLAVDDLDGLKRIVLSALVLVVVVSFVDAAVSSAGSPATLELGAAAAAVIVAVGAYLRLAGR